MTLAERNQILLSEGNMVLTFQGHPEMSGELAGALLGAKSEYTQELGVEEREVLRCGVEGHAGLRVWGRILEWVGE